MTTSDKSRARLPRIFASVVLGAGVAATCAAASPASSATSTTPTASGTVHSTAKPTAKGTAGGATSDQSTAIVRAGVTHRLGVQPTATTPLGYAPADLQSAYNLASAAATGGKGATVAIIGIGDDPTAASDLAVYRAQYGLPACTAASGCLTKVNASGQSSPLPTVDPIGTSWTAAMSMGMDMVSGICPNCHILLVERAYPTDGSDLGPAVDSAVALGAKYVIVANDSGSFASAADDAEYYNHPGVAIAVPSGDNGLELPTSAVNFPAESPFVTTVGGTTLTRTSNARGWAETVWQPVQAQAYQTPSSQCALEYGKPSWQTDAGCAGRTDNDVAAVANPATGVSFYDTAAGYGGWNVGGGTTVAASIVGAVYALAGTPAADSYPASYPYLNAGGGLYPVTSGSNVLPGNTCIPVYLCTAGPGYNGPAGLGTPDGTAAFAPPAAATVGLIGPAAQGAHVLPESVSLQLPAEDSAGQPLTFTAAGLPPGLTIDPGTGLISGTVTAYYDGTVSVTATDATGATATASFSWLAENEMILNTPPTQQTQPDSAATLTVRAGDAGKDQTVSYAAAGLPPGLSIDAATGVISGTTTATIGSYHVTLTATDGTGSSASASFTWRVWNTVAVSAPTSELTQATVAVNVPVSATDSAAGQTLTFSAVGLPAGLSINPASGVITGSATAANAYSVTVTAADGTGSQGSATISWSIIGTITIPNPGSLVSTAGQTVELPLKATDTATGVSLNYTIAGGPPGIDVYWDYYAPDGWQSATLAGWPAPAGTYKTTITAEGTGTGTTSVSFNWTVEAASGAGPTGPVPLGPDGKCLDDTGDSSANGNKIQLWACNGGAAQRWTYAQDGTLRINGKCLDDAGYGISAGTKLQLWSCLNHTNQMWSPVFAAELQGTLSGLCLADPGGSTRNGTQVELARCLGGDSEAWTLPAGEIISGVPGECMTDSGAGTANGTAIELEPCVDSTSQRWTAEPDGTVRIFGKCLSLQSGFGAPAVLWSCGDAFVQQWSVVNLGFSLVSVISGGGYYLEAPATASGTQLTLGDAGSPEAEWHLW